MAPFCAKGRANPRACFVLLCGPPSGRRRGGRRGRPPLRPRPLHPWCRSGPSQHAPAQRAQTSAERARLVRARRGAFRAAWHGGFLPNQSASAQRFRLAPFYRVGIRGRWRRPARGRLRGPRVLDHRPVFCAARGASVRARGALVERPDTVVSCPGRCGPGGGGAGHIGVHARVRLLSDMHAAAADGLGRRRAPSRPVD